MRDPDRFIHSYQLEHGAFAVQPPLPTIDREERERIRQMLRLGAFAAYCSGYGCGRALYVGGEYVHCALGTYCKSCWNEIQTDIRVEHEWGHDHAQ